MIVMKTAVLFLTLAAGAFSQSHLDPTNYPSFGTPGWCDTAGKKAAYEELWKGLKTYSVGLGTPASVCMEECPTRYYNPVIDGYLEDSLWYNAETLLINSWEVSG